MEKWTVTFYLVPGVRNRKFYLVLNDSYEKLYLAVKGFNRGLIHRTKHPVGGGNVYAALGPEPWLVEVHALVVHGRRRQFNQQYRTPVSLVGDCISVKNRYYRSNTDIIVNTIDSFNIIIN